MLARNQWKQKKVPNVGVFSWDLMGGTGIEYDIMGYLSNNVAIVGIKTTTQEGYDRDTIGRLAHCQTIGDFPSKSSHRG